MSSNDNHTKLAESLSAIFICMAIASMCFALFFVYQSSRKLNFMSTILIMLILSALIRVIERFKLTDSFFDPDESSIYGVILGVEIALTWSTLLLAEFFMAMKYF